MTVAILILAAGASSRMRGADKTLQLIDSKPLLSEVIARAEATSCPVFVALPAPDHPRAACLVHTTAKPIFVPNAALGMGQSIATSVQYLPENIEAVMIVPADMPGLHALDLQTILTAYIANPGQIIRAVDAAETPGHPVVFPRSTFPALKRLSGDDGAKSVLKSAKDQIIFVPLPGQNATQDLDTPEDWAAYYAAQS